MLIAVHLLKLRCVELMNSNLLLLIILPCLCFVLKRICHHAYYDV